MTTPRSTPANPSSDPRPAIPPARYTARLQAAREALNACEHAAIFVGVGPDLRYLTGFVGEPMERLTLLVIPREGPVSFVVPRLEADKAAATPLVSQGGAQVVSFEETDDPAQLVAELLAAPAIAAGRGAWESFAVSDRLWSMHLLALERVLSGRRFESAAPIMGQLRRVKDADEAELLRLAAGAADRTVDAIAAGRLVGRTEGDVAREVRQRLIDEGHDLADFAIVGSGPNAALPHHDSGDRVIGAGEALVLDIGGVLAGYFSDTTRTIWVAGEEDTQPPEEFRRAYQLVQAAQAAGTEAVRPGVAAQDVDKAARGVIEAGGFGERFTHRTGHGIGLEVHEDPYIVAGNDEPLALGMAFSVEPGIYLPGRFGVRLENIVLVTASGHESLNRSSLDLRVVRG